MTHPITQNQAWSDMLAGIEIDESEISELNSHAHLTDLLDYESEALSQFMNLGLSFWYRMTLPIPSHKAKLEALY
jgi:hypothetical protein